jgi:hypothetical protein
MGEMLKIFITIPKTFKSNYILPAITLIFHLLNFKMSSESTLVHIQLSSTFSSLQCSCIILLWLKNSWTLVHELLHCLSMFLDILFTFLIGIFNQVSFPLYQIFKICLPPGLLSNSLIHDLFHLRLFSYRPLFDPLNFLMILYSSRFIFFVRVHIFYVEYG